MNELSVCLNLSVVLNCEACGKPIELGRALQLSGASWESIRNEVVAVAGAAYHVIQRPYFCIGHSHELMLK